MRRWIRRTGIVLLVLLLILAAMWTASRLSGPTPGQRAALETFAQLPEPQGRNAFPLMWLLQWDVPDAELEALTAEDVARFLALPPPGDPERTEATLAYRSVAAEHYPDLAGTLADTPAACVLREAGCLATVRADRDAHAARLEAAERLVDRVETVAGYGHVRHLLPAALDAPLPRLQWYTLPLTRHALWFADGEHARAMAATCRSLAGYRRQSADTDFLIYAMVGLAAVSGHAGLLAEMLAELPADHPLPEECAQALAPLQTQEFDICPAMHGEWHWGEAVLDGMAEGLSPAQRLLSRIVYDRQASAALRAEFLVWPCGEEAARLRAEDVPLHPLAFPERPWRFECWANSAGCLLMQIAVPAYSGYAQRMQDAAARIRLLQTLVWMREQAAAGEVDDPRALLAARPEALRSVQRAFALDEDGTGLRMDLFEQRGDMPGSWRIPLPPALHALPEEAP